MVVINLTSEVKKLDVFLVYTTIDDVKVEKNRVDVAEYTKKIIKFVKEAYTLGNLTRHPIIRAYRKFMWSLGIDPTKVRPSSEALVRRILRTGNLRNINNVVDSGNFASIETLVPIGIYDLSKITGELVLRYAKKGEIFRPIGGKDEVLTGNEVVLSDKEKILHVFPHRDSAITAISEDTHAILIIATGVTGVPKHLVIDAVRRTIKYVKLFANGKNESEVYVVE